MSCNVNEGRMLRYAPSCESQSGSSLVGIWNAFQKDPSKALGQDKLEQSHSTAISRVFQTAATTRRQSM